MNFLSVINFFERWLEGEHLIETEISFIYLTLVLCVLSIILLVMLIWMAHLCNWGTVSNGSSKTYVTDLDGI